MDIPYILPKDRIETNRLDFQHYLLRALLHKNYIVPLQTGVRTILDVGCGTGLWAREVARAFPQAHVTGIDIEPPQHTTDLHNCHFLQGDILNGLAFPDNSFDYVHQRLLVAGIPALCWPSVVQDLVRVTRSGGYVEFLEAGHTFEHAGPETQRFMFWWQTVSTKNGFDTTLMEQLGTLLQQAGLHHIREKRIKVPVGKWGGHTGEMLALNMYQGFIALKGLYCAQVPVTPSLFDATVAALPDEWERCQTSYYFYVAYGCK